MTDVDVETGKSDLVEIRVTSGRRSRKTAMRRIPGLAIGASLLVAVQTGASNAAADSKMLAPLAHAVPGEVIAAPGKQATLFVVNDTGTTITVSGATINTADGSTDVPAFTVVRGDGPTADAGVGTLAGSRISAAQRLPLTVSTTAKAPPTATAELVVAIAPIGEESTGTVVRVALRATAAKRITPAVEKWTVTDARWTPWSSLLGGPRFLDRKVPLADSSPCTEGNALPSAVLSSGDDVAHVSAKCGVVKGGHPVAVLSVTGDSDRGSTYTGKLRLLGDDEAGDVALTLHRRDAWPFPFFVMAVGILLGLYAKRRRDVVGVLQPYCERLGEHEWAKLSDEGPPAYSIENLMRARVAQLCALTKRIRRTHVLTLAADDKDLRSLQAGMTELDTLEADWNALTDLVSDLRETSRNFDPPKPAHAGQMLGAPAAKAALAPMLPKGELKKEDLAARSEQLGSQRTFLLYAWHEAAADIARLQEWVNRLRPAVGRGTDTARELKSLESDLHAAEIELWHYSNKAAAEQGGLPKKLGIIRESLAKLHRAVADPLNDDSVRKLEVAAGLNEDWLEDRLEVVRTEAVWHVDGPIVVGPDAAQHVVVTIPKWWSVILRWLPFAVAAFTAAWAGLASLWLGKDFGSLPDYLTALAWGLAVPPVLDVLVSAIDKLRPFAARA